MTKLLEATKPAEDKKALYEWRQRVGEAEADRISTESKNIGNSLDSLAMKFMQPGFDQRSHALESGYELFLQLRPHLANIEPIGTQLYVWSERLKTRGYLDILGINRTTGKIILVDVKNTKREKADRYLQDYKMQTAFYAMMVYDTFGIKVQELGIYLGRRDSNVAQIVHATPNDYIPGALKRVKDYQLSL